MGRDVRYVAVIFGAALAPVLVGLLSLVYQGFVDGSVLYFSYVFIVALGHVVVFGLPAAIVLQRLRLANIVTALIAGFLIGALPFALLMALSSTGNLSIDGVVTVLDGRRTTAGWIELAKAAGVFGLFGTAGGLTAWAIWRGDIRAAFVWTVGMAAVSATTLLED